MIVELGKYGRMIDVLNSAALIYGGVTQKTVSIKL